MTVKNTVALYTPAPHAQFGPYSNFMNGQCMAASCDTNFKSYGYTVGCQVISTGIDNYEPPPVFYSIPGSCPSQPWSQKTSSCKAANPGGQCAVPAGANNCTWHLEEAGEITL